MIAATIWKMGFHLPDFNLQAFHPRFLRFTLSGFSRLLALMTGIEVFANLVAAYDGTPEQRSRKAFRSLLIAMGTTSATMLIVGPAIFALSDSTNDHVSVFTQAMDKILPLPLAYFGTFIGVVVLGSAAAASAQGLQNLALGLRYRHYVPARMGQRNRFDVAALPVWIEVGIVCVCFIFLGTQEDIYLSLYAVGVFVLLSMTGWAAAKRTLRIQGRLSSIGQWLPLSGSIVAALLTSAATIIIFVERFMHGAWAYFLLIPAIYFWLSFVRSRLGEPVPLTEHLGRLYSGQYLLPYEREGRSEQDETLEDILVPLDGSSNAEMALPIAEFLARALGSRLTLLSAVNAATQATDKSYLKQKAAQLQDSGLKVDHATEAGQPDVVIAGMARDLGSDLIVMTTHGHSSIERLFVSDTAQRTIRRARVPILLIHPNHARNQQIRFQRLLVALDGSRTAEDTLSYARIFAQALGSELLLLGVPEADSEAPHLLAYIEKVAQALRARNLKARALVTGSGPAQTIVEVTESEKCDMVMLAEGGRGGFHRQAAVGSVAMWTIQSVQCPIFLVDSTRQH